MSKAKLEKAIYYIGDDSELGTAVKVQENLAQRVGKKEKPVPIVKFGTKDQEVPGELILLAHSDDTRTTIGDLTPSQLARQLASQFSGKDKTQLKSIKLVSCEGGYGDSPLALELAKELFKRGFTEAVVKAATHPRESKIGGVVSVTTHAGISRLYGGEDGKVTAVMYGNEKTADYIQYKELRQLSLQQRRHPELWDEDKANKMRALADKHSNFEGFDEQHPDYCVIQLIGDINELDAPQHCYTAKGVQAQFSLDSAIALECLRTQRLAADMSHNKKVGSFIDKIVAEINRNPSIDKNGIFQIIGGKEISKGIKNKIVTDIQNHIASAIDQKRTAMDPHSQPSKAVTIASKIENQEACLDRVLKKDGVLDKLWQRIYGVGEFTRGLRAALMRISHQTLNMKVEREEIIGLIERQKVIDSNKFEIKKGGLLGFGAKTQATALKSLYDALGEYNNQKNPTTGDRQRLQEAIVRYNAQPANDPKSEALVQLIARLDANNHKYNELEKNIQQIDTKVTDAIQAYLGKYDKGTDTDITHQPKVAVMKAILEYVKQPTEENWNSVERSTENNEGWDKGMFSKVRFMMSETRKVREEQQQLEQDMSPNSPHPKM